MPAVVQRVLGVQSHSVQALVDEPVHWLQPEAQLPVQVPWFEPPQFSRYVPVLQALSALQFQLEQSPVPLPLQVLQFAAQLLHVPEL